MAEQMLNGNAHLSVRALVFVLDVLVGQRVRIELELAVFGGNDRAFDSGVLLRADIDGIRSDDARLSTYPGRGR